MSTLTVQLGRSDNSQPWGFRIHGGADFADPLIVLKVAAGSLSQQQGLAPGDQIIQINGEDAVHLRHREAQQKIINAGNRVQFQVIRGDSANMERVVIGSSQALPTRVNRQSSLKQTSTTSTKSSSSSTSVTTVIQNSSGVTTTAVTQGWKGPKYSEENIRELLTSQSQVLDGGAIGVNFMKPDEKEELDMKKSAVLRMLHEMEEEDRQKRAQAKSAQQEAPQPENSTFGICMNRAFEAACQAQQSQAPWAHSPKLPISEPIEL